jgi:hypothetical protein
MGRLRTGRSSRAVGVAAVLGLVVVSLLMLYFIDVSNLLNPTGPTNTAPAPPAPSHSATGPQLNGSLVISVTSNQNTTDRLAPPTNASSPAKGVPIVTTFSDANSSSQVEHLWITNTNGLTGCIECLPVGLYVVSIKYDGLEITVPATVFVDEQTKVQVSFTERSYDLTYCAESGVLVTPSAARYTMFASVNSPVTVANASQPVYLNVLEGASGTAGYSVNATVVSQGAPTMGTQWLQLGTLSPVDLQDATSISMTAWTSSTATTVGPVTYLQGVLTP